MEKIYSLVVYKYTDKLLLRTDLCLYLISSKKRQCLLYCFIDLLKPKFFECCHAYTQIGRDSVRTINTLAITLLL